MDREILQNLKKITIAHNSSEIRMSYFCRWLHAVQPCLTRWLIAFLLKKLQSWDSKVYFPIHSLPVGSIMKQVGPVHTVTHVSFKCVLILSSCLRLYLLTGLFPYEDIWWTAQMIKTVMYFFPFFLILKSTYFSEHSCSIYYSFTMTYQILHLYKTGGSVTVFIIKPTRCTNFLNLFLE